jgi:hypothetical protein
MTLECCDRTQRELCTPASANTGCELEQWKGVVGETSQSATSPQALSKMASDPIRISVVVNRVTIDLYAIPASVLDADGAPACVTVGRGPPPTHPLQQAPISELEGSGESSLAFRPMRHAMARRLR